MNTRPKQGSICTKLVRDSPGVLLDEDSWNPLREADARLCQGERSGPSSSNSQDQIVVKAGSAEGVYVRPKEAKLRGTAGRARASLQCLIARSCARRM